MDFLDAFSHLDWPLVLHLTWQHITLVGIAVTLAIVIGVPLGIFMGASPKSMPTSVAPPSPLAAPPPPGRCAAVSVALASGDPGFATRTWRIHQGDYVAGDESAGKWNARRNLLGIALRRGADPRSTRRR